ncbi:aldose 1-epimerase family protein [Methylocella silvestris]|uniref:aldose epimerase family protein n=1 Tax=Methylocella silvestris TaxID=199596 RepID=UPI000323B15B|nr:aldose 1-epimerase family protein [Methylocella silvestris]
MTAAAGSPLLAPLAPRRLAEKRFSMDVIELSVGSARATIALRGAEAMRWSVGGTPLLWDKDPAIWDATSPLLFPLVGWTHDAKIRVEGKSYPAEVHGFASRMCFSPSTTSAQRARLTLSSSAETLAVYPFDFWLGVNYALFDTALAVGLTVKNRDARPMPYACGLHPGFHWPFAGGTAGDYAIMFAAEEQPFAPKISPQGLFCAEQRALPLQGRRLPLSPELFSAEALCFLNTRSRSLSFEGPEGAAIKVETSNFPHVALWSKPGARFLSIESWTGYGDPEGFCGELAEKPSMRILQPGAVAHHVARYSWRAPQTA